MSRPHATVAEPFRRRRGMSLIEIMIVVAMISLVMVMGLKPMHGAAQKANAHAARVAVLQNVALARATAVARGCQATFNVDTLTGKSWVTSCRVVPAAGSTLDTVGLLDNTERRFGVQILTSTPSIVYDPRGLSMGGTSASFRLQGISPGAVDSFYVNSIGKVMR